MSDNVQPEHLVPPALLAELAENFRNAQSGPIRLLTPLPRKVRFRLWWQHQVDCAACWLCEHRQCSAAVILWRAFGMWR